MTKHQWAYQNLGWYDLDDRTRTLFEMIEIELMPLRRQLVRMDEADLSTDQINKIFAGAEQISRDKGMRTAFGKTVGFPKDTLVTINRVLGNFGKKLQDSGPVQAVDAKFDQLKQKLKSTLGKTEQGRKALSYVEALGNAAKRHPAWQGAIIGLLTAVSGMVAGPALIPVVAFLLKGATELVKGEKLSTALGKGIYAGALGFLGSQVASALMGWFEALRIDAIKPVGPSDLNFRTITFSGQSTNTVAGMEWTRWFRVSNVTVDPAMQGAINDAILRMGSGDLGAYDRLLSLARRVASPEYLAELRNQLDAATAARINNDGFVSSIRAIKNYVVSAAGGAGAAAAGAGEKKQTTESVEVTQEIMEGLWADLTLRFGAGKLMKAWQAAGRPTDSVDIAQMLANMGMEQDDIRQLMVDAGLGEDDVNATMRGLAQATDDEIEIPFKSGFADLDKEAEKILKQQGSEAFAKYWEEKIKELEAKLSAPADAGKTGDAGAAGTAEKTDWPALRKDIFAAIKVKDRARLRNLIGKLTDLTGPQKDILMTNLKASGIDQNTQMQLRKLINKATVSEEYFMEISRWLNESSLTWKDVGFSHVYREPRTATVILL